MKVKFQLFPKPYRKRGIFALRLSVWAALVHFPHPAKRDVEWLFLMQLNLSYDKGKALQFIYNFHLSLWYCRKCGGSQIGSCTRAGPCGCESDSLNIKHRGSGLLSFRGHCCTEHVSTSPSCCPDGTLQWPPCTSDTNWFKRVSHQTRDMKIVDWLDRDTCWPKAD